MKAEIETHARRTHLLLIKKVQAREHSLSRNGNRSLIRKHLAIAITTLM